MKGKRGITLVSLVVTIIVLIILAGVSINLTLGENGIITMAKRARENMELAKLDDEKQLNELYAQIVTEGASSGNSSNDAIIRLAEFKREIANVITDMGIETAETADVSTMTGNIRNLVGASSADKVIYNNTNSELSATNVQEAVDELDNEFNELEELVKDSNTNYTFLGEFTMTTTSNPNLGTINDSLEKYKSVLLIASAQDTKINYGTLILPNTEILYASDNRLAAYINLPHADSKVMSLSIYTDSGVVSGYTQISNVNKLIIFGIK